MCANFACGQNSLGGTMFVRANNIFRYCEERLGRDFESCRIETLIFALQGNREIGTFHIGKS